MPNPAGRGAAALSGRVRDFLAGRQFLVLATNEPDAPPRQALIWYDLRGDELLVNSRSDRRWPRNLRRDPRVSAAVFDPHDPLRWVGITGEVAAIDDDPERALADIQALARRYHPGDARREAQFAGQSRVTFRIRILSTHVHLD